MGPRNRTGPRQKMEGDERRMSTVKITKENIEKYTFCLIERKERTNALGVEQIIAVAPRHEVETGDEVILENYGYFEIKDIRKFWDHEFKNVEFFLTTMAEEDEVKKIDYILNKLKYKEEAEEE